MPITVPKLDTTGNQIAIYNTPRAQYRSEMPAEYTLQNRCGTDSISKFIYGGSLSGKSDCTDYVDPQLSFNMQGTYFHDKNGVRLNNTLSTIDVLQGAAAFGANSQWRGLTVVELYPNGDIKYALRFNHSQPVYDICNAQIGWRISNSITEYVYDDDCNYLTAAVESTSYFYNLSSIGNMTEARTKANEFFFASDMLTEARKTSGTGASVWLAKAKALSNVTL